MTDKASRSGDIGSPKINPLRNASVNMVRQDSWCIYADGFKCAAELLITNVKSTYEVNTVIFPILALYRQYVELSLKEIIAYGQYLEEHDVQQGGHDLKNLWVTTKSYIRKHYQDFGRDQLDRIEQLVCELYELDPTSEATCRVPRHREHSFARKIRVFCVRDVSDPDSYSLSICEIESRPEWASPKLFV